MWQGLLALKNDQAAVQMHFVFGNPLVARESLPCNSDGSTPPLRIAQRMRLEQTQLEGVARKMQVSGCFTGMMWWQAAGHTDKYRTWLHVPCLEVTGL